MTELEANHHRVGELLALAETRGSIGSWSWKAGQDHVEWSDGLRRLAGIASSDGAVSLEACRKLVHPEDLRAISDWRALLSMNWLDDRLVRIVRADGEIRRLRVHGRTMQDDAGRLLGASGICIDVTDGRTDTIREDAGLTHAQVRAARAYLGWTALQLAKKAGVSFSTVRRVEMPGRRAVRDENLDAIRQAFTRSGVRFVVHEDGAIGIAAR